MNVLDKIEKLRLQRGWTYYTLALESELTVSTVTNMFIRKTQPSIKTLTALCKAFGITLSEFFDDNNDSVGITNDEHKLINKFRKLNKKEKEAVMAFIDKLQ